MIPTLDIKTMPSTRVLQEYPNHLKLSAASSASKPGIFDHTVAKLITTFLITDAEIAQTEFVVSKSGLLMVKTAETSLFLKMKYGEWTPINDIIDIRIQ